MKKKKRRKSKSPWNKECDFMLHLRTKEKKKTAVGQLVVFRYHHRHRLKKKRVFFFTPKICEAYKTRKQKKKWEREKKKPTSWLTWWERRCQWRWFSRSRKTWIRNRWSIGARPTPFQPALWSGWRWLPSCSTWSIPAACRTGCCSDWRHRRLLFQQKVTGYINVLVYKKKNLYIYI